MQPSGPIEIIKKSIQIFIKKENLIYFLKIYSILIPFVVINYFFDLYTKNLNIGTDLASISRAFSAIPPVIMIIVFLMGLAYLVVSFWVSAAGILGVSNVLTGNLANVKEVLKLSWKKLWMFSLLSLLVGLVITLGFLLLIIPGIIFMVWYQFSSFELLTKGIGIGTAMEESKKLISGKFFPVFGRVLMFGLFGIIVQIAVGIIPLGIGSLILPLLGPLFILPYFLLYKELSV